MEYVIIIIFVLLILCLFFGLVNLLEMRSETRNSYSNYKRRNNEKPRPDHTGFIPYTQEWKNKHLEWVEAGLCGSCGAPSGEEKGICDECRWS